MVKHERFTVTYEHTRELYTELFVTGIEIDQNAGIPALQQAVAYGKMVTKELFDKEACFDERGLYDLRRSR
jgi:hypothetical protein